MDYVRLGYTGLKVSRLCLGAMTYGTSKWRAWVLDEADRRNGRSATRHRQGRQGALRRRVEHVRVAVREDPARRRPPRLDAVRDDAESLQPDLPRGRARAAAVLPRPGDRRHSVESAGARVSRRQSPPGGSRRDGSREDRRVRARDVLRRLRFRRRRSRGADCRAARRAAGPDRARVAAVQAGRHGADRRRVQAPPSRGSGWRARHPPRRGGDAVSRGLLPAASDSRPLISRQSFVALRHRNFRLIWIGLLVSFTGSMMQNAALLWHVSLLVTPERQGLALGMVGLVRVVPVVVFSMISGVVADAWDRRRLMLFTQTAATLVAPALASIAFSGVTGVWLIYVLAALGSAVGAFDLPARNALVPTLVPREHLPNAISLNTIMFQTASVVGPSLGGLLIA